MYSGTGSSLSDTFGITLEVWTESAPFSDMLEIFEVGRSVFASSFPVVKLFSYYHAIRDAFDAIAEQLAELERDRLLANHARPTYRI